MTKVLESLAAYTYANYLDVGGKHARSSLLVAVLADRHDIDVAELLELVRRGGDDRVAEAGNEVDRLIAQARRADLFRQMGEEDSA